jgi:predicted transcriptional regulator
MTERLIRSWTDWAAVFRSRITELGYSHLEVDHRAGLPDGYCNKILNGKKKPGAVTIERMCGALGLALRPVVENCALECVEGLQQLSDAPRNKTEHSHVERT